MPEQRSLPVRDPTDSDPNPNALPMLPFPPPMRPRYWFGLPITASVALMMRTISRRLAAPTLDGAASDRGGQALAVADSDRDIGHYRPEIDGGDDYGDLIARSVPVGVLLCAQHPLTRSVAVRLGLPTEARQ